MARPQQTSTETILDSLATHPEVTVADLADVLGIGRSTVAKRLGVSNRSDRSGASPAGGYAAPGAKPLVDCLTVMEHNHSPS